jgi:hypothetical protein
MNPKQLTPILLAILLACLAFPAKSIYSLWHSIIYFFLEKNVMRSIDTDTAVAGEGERWWAGGDMETSSTGSIRWLPDGEEMVGSSKFTVVLCMKTSCKPGKKSCYCCRTLPDNASCFWTQQQCWDSCPAAPLAATPAAAVASSILEELCRSIT